MFETDSELDPAETVSSLALDVIDELRMKMLECLLVVQTLPDEADLNFTDLANDILAAHRSTLEAYQAASIVHQGAELDERWGNSLSRPKAVFARHNAAVRHGATKVTPMPALCDRLERHLYQLPRPDRTQTIVGQRPRCSGVVKSTGEDCTNSAIYLGSGMFGAHCYLHATSTEREQYRVHHEENDARQARTHHDLRNLQRAVGEKIAAHWISTREQRTQWVEAVVLN
ncbi:hypothetical protein [Mycobacteroides abscessus]|uniref:hypothetical protein n=1 Tax=Mycobacteroides abscessus TaxID=36809 RepID=UPI000268380F|nr:hypothetical protein [Mycobacteroides abscessus]EIT89203.1 hypothetical protein MA4S0303_2999 [Mycobacteroides abscessus 4S-0303]EIT91195.1 hypothetical protein MA4S0726RB_2522 [Mycobacteroides abscessus 4S-0726-RB]EIT94744.1 hypothetical protein MA4S0726RA_2932 [Mycobacteroides abscessus 4S-0726-RA]EIV09546.1 hypothetical protein MA4S0206_3017 [Mycobacteroides abscessus 4S-0206]EIV47793.1 hypothetical protein MA4S0116R_2975 [Mycobacteroides abscessus 4S-0116-R]